MDRPLFALKIAPSFVGTGLPSNTWFLGPNCIHIPNCISIGSAVFAQLTAESLYFTMGRPFYLQNCSFAWRDLDFHLIHVHLSQYPERQHD